MKTLLLGKRMFDQTIGVLQRSLDIRTARHGVLSGNIANADTADYQTKDLPFRKILERSAENLSALPLRRSHPLHFPDTEDPSSSTVWAREAESGPEGEGVNIDQEMAKLAENNLNFQAGIQSLIKKLEALKLSISEGR